MTVTINGTTGIAGTNGSAATPAVQGEDTNTGVFFPAADTVAVSTSGTERLRIHASGGVSIGTTTDNGAGSLTVSGAITAATLNGSLSQAQVISSVEYTTPSDASGYTWVRFAYNGFNAGEHQLEFYVTRSIFFNGSSPYGGCTAKFTAQAREWHGGQEFMTVQYGEHGANTSYTQGYYITHARIADQAGGGNWVYLRMRAGITFRFYDALHGNGSVNFSTLQGGSDPGSAQPIYHGVNLLSTSGALNYYYNGQPVIHAGNISSYSTVSTSAVLSATAGAGAGEVGTYAFCANPTNENSAFAAGATIAGSRLRYVAIYRQSSGTMSVEYYGTPSGTWRVMSHIQNYLNWGVGMGLVLRIS